jgi:hypothetical protein
LKTLIIDNFLTTDECNFIIKYYESDKNKNSNKIRNIFPIAPSLKDKNINFLINKLQTTASNFNSKIDWFQIVKWPEGSSQDLHIDDASNETTLSSIIYLNDEFKGGQTYYEDGTIFKPIRGRGLFFDGMYYTHGVKIVEKGTRFVVATWYKKL